MDVKNGKDRQRYVEEYNKQSVDVMNSSLLIMQFLDIDTEVIYSQLFTRMPQGIDHCLAVLFFFLHWFSGWFSLVSNSYTKIQSGIRPFQISYTETANIGLYSFNNFHDKYKILVNITTCASCFIIGLLMCSSVSY